jgi:hypothetical protein
LETWGYKHNNSWLQSIIYDLIIMR